MKDKASVRIGFGGIVVGSAWILTFVSVLTSNSVAILSDFVNSSLQLLSLIITWYVDRRISGKKNPLYNYGPSKIEGFTAIIVGIVFFVSTIGLSLVVFNRFLNPEKTGGAGIWIVMVFAIIFASLNANLYYRVRREYCERKKAHLDAEGRIYLIKAISNSGLFVSITVSSFSPFKWSEYFDPVFSSVIIILMFINMIQLFRKNLPGILDHAISESSQMVVTQALAEHFAEYEQYYGMKSRYSGEKVFIDLFLLFDVSLPTRETLSRAYRIEDAIEDRIPSSEVTVIITDGKKKGDI